MRAQKAFHIFQQKNVCNLNIERVLSTMQFSTIKWKMRSIKFSLKYGVSVVKHYMLSYIISSNYAYAHFLIMIFPIQEAL